MKAVIANDNSIARIIIKLIIITKQEERKSLKFENHALEVIDVLVGDRCYTARAAFKF